MSLGALILALVTLQRLGELWLSNRNTRRLLASGAVEHGPSHYPWIVALHIFWLGALWLVGPGRPVSVFWLIIFLILQVGRVWVIATLGRRWTTRIIILPGEPLVKRGPYRWIDHPNYVVVAGEIAVLPLVFGFWDLAILFSALNGAILAIRIRAENKALGRD